MPNKSPKVSVLTPIYNTNPQHLREMIESVLNQTFDDFEFLILNDSPDNTEIENIVKEYAAKDKRIKYFKNEKNIGISDSRNKLMELAAGEYIAIVDHDDISLPDRFIQQVDFLDKNPHIGVVSGWIEYYIEGKRTGKYWQTVEHNIKIKERLTVNCEVCHPTAMIRRSVLIENNIKYEAKYSPCEDYIMWIRLFDKTRFYNIQNPLLLYRMHDNRTSILYENKMKTITHDISYLARSKFSAYYEELLKSETLNKTIFRLRLFGFFPLFKIKNNKVYLFDFLPICKIMWK